MRFRLMLTAAIAAAFAAAMPADHAHVITAGDQNMVEYVTNYLGPSSRR